MFTFNTVPSALTKELKLVADDEEPNWTTQLGAKPFPVNVISVPGWKCCGAVPLVGEIEETYPGTVLIDE
jgi:hypothetical protein